MLGSLENKMGKGKKILINFDEIIIIVSVLVLLRTPLKIVNYILLCKYKIFESQIYKQSTE